MKTLRQIREEYDANFLDGFAPDEFMFESTFESPRTKSSSLMPTRSIPSAKEMPVMLLFRRVSYRLYPNRQVVALYYSSMIDKYLSVPFGPGGNVNLSEATIVDNLDEDWQDVNRKDKTDGLSQKAVNAYRRENPGSKLQTAVTEKNPSGKRASRRKSFCSRMGGMKKRLTSAKTARDPDSRINKALRRWNCEEEFRSRLNTIREEKVKPWMDYSDLGGAIKTATELTPGASAYQKYKEGDYAGAAKSGAIDVALGGAAKALSAAGKGLKFLKGGAKTANKARKAAPTPKTTPKSTPKKGGFWSSAAGSAAGSIVGGGSGDNTSSAGGSGATSSSDTSLATATMHRPAGTIKTGSSWKVAGRSHDAAFQSKMKQAEIKRAKELHENKISDIRTMIEEGIESIELPINGRQVTLNTSMAKRILEVYDSVNTKNKKIVEGMLNEDLESFKKLLNFSIRN